MRWKSFKVHNVLPDARGADFYFPNRAFSAGAPLQIFYAFEGPSSRFNHSFLFHDLPAFL